MKKTFNPRPIVFVAAAQITGIFFAAYFSALGAWAIVIPSAIVTAIGAAVFAAFKRRRVLIAIVYALCIAFLLAGAFTLRYKAEKVTEDSQKFPAGEYVITGVVEYASYSNGLYGVRLSDCRLNGEPSGNVAIYGLKTGVSTYDKIETRAFVGGAQKYSRYGYSSLVLSGSSFVCYNGGEAKIIGYKDCAAYRFRRFTDSRFAHTSRKNRVLAAALVRGDTVGLADRVNAYRAAGIAHVFAVSGLHVGLLYGLLALLFAKIPLHRTVKAVLISVLLFGYSLVCGLTASSVRAAVMCSVFALAKSVGEKRDSLNSLALASLAVLLINPSDLLGLGYLLSFLICFSLITLAPTIRRATKIKSPKLGGSIGVTVAAEVAAVPLGVKYFGSFPLITAVSNFFLVPVVTVCYYATFFGLFASLIIPAKAAFFVAENLLTGTEFFITRLSSVNSAITVFPSWLLPAYYLAALFCSDAVNVGKITKTVLFAAILISLVALTFISLV